MERIDPGLISSNGDLAVLPDVESDDPPLDIAVDWVLRELAVKVVAAHELLLRAGDLPEDLPGVLPSDRALTAGEAFELAQDVYILACATRSSVARCDPGLVLLAATWRASPTIGPGCGSSRRSSREHRYR